MKYVWLMIFCVFLGCGNHTKIEYHEVDEATMAAVSGSPLSIGYARWHDRKYVVYCDIYLLPYDLYESAECYELVVLHERRHCYEFNFPGSHTSSCKKKPEQ